MVSPVTKAKYNPSPRDHRSSQVTSSPSTSCHTRMPDKMGHTMRKPWPNASKNVFCISSPRPVAPFYTSAREETRESRGMPDLFHNTGWVWAAKRPEISDLRGFPRHFAMGCVYRLCHPNVVPMETAEPSD